MPETAQALEERDEASRLLEELNLQITAIKDLQHTVESLVLERERLMHRIEVTQLQLQVAQLAFRNLTLEVEVNELKTKLAAITGEKEQVTINGD